MIPNKCKQCKEEVVWWAIVVNICQMTYKGLLGAMTGSVALVADSLHSGADVIASIVTMLCVKISKRKASDKYPYGFGNIQFISSSIVGIILILGAIYLMYESILKIIEGNIEAPSFLAVLGAGMSVVVNELMYRYQHCVGKENNSPAIIANAWDNRSDALSSVGVLIGILFAVLGFPIADVVAAMVVAILVARIGIELNIDAIDGLMDTSVEMDVLKDVYNIAANVPNIEEVRHLRGRNVGEDIHLDISIGVSGSLKVYESDLIAQALKERIYAEVRHVTDVQIAVVNS
ncbi:magnetosome biogenesis CDF transporter MamB [Terasakiella sp. SH-1]|uniref:magnetosome biogenesis CDF transporter MamB n=1 Tax=Terasakiella sp. SH-1 TaxID=2560057 RepID=UPI00107362DD|nr:magnetosome biogenesis CDF transporter MamB [Terasakiella sp. SH-1]